MRKNTKCINIFEQNKKNLNLYEISTLIILLIILFQVSTNVIKYKQLNDFVSSQNLHEILENNKVNNSSLDNKNLHTQECNTNLSKLKEASSIIGAKKINSIYSDSNKVEIKGFCKDIKVLEKLSNMKNISGFNIKSLQKENQEYLFDVEYKLGGKIESN